MKKILVIGGTGFIGYHVIKEAIKRKWKVTSISLHKPSKKKVQSNVKYKIVNTSDIPTDRSFRNAWYAEEADLTDGVGS